MILYGSKGKMSSIVMNVDYYFLLIDSRNKLREKQFGVRCSKKALASTHWWFW